MKYCVLKFIQPGVYYCATCQREWNIPSDENAVRVCETVVERKERLTVKECPHYLGSNGQTAKLFGCGCPSSQVNGIDISVCACELPSHPKCYPVQIPNTKEAIIEPNDIQLCVTCPDNPSNKVI